MQICLISDTHGTRPVVPAGDVLIHCGDLTHLGSFQELRTEAAWLKSLPHKHKVIIAGNHDCFAFNIYNAGQEAELKRFLLSEGIVYLRDSTVEIKGVKFYGSPWIRPYAGAFNLPTEDIRQKWAAIPSDTQVLVTHTPPQGILDSGYGCPELRKALSGLQHLRLHAYGHVEERFGQTKIGKTLYVNAAISTRRSDGSTRTPHVLNLDVARKAASCLSNR